MDPAIQILSDQTINQIAAGEVIENPASVVKELVENALDAGARHVKIEIKAGGQQLIRVVDDGCGMGSDDAVLCFERFATSKIRSSEDLFHLATMGFRGEALASIAAIAKVSLHTCKENGVGTAVEIAEGKILSVGPCARTKGTTIEVRSLFYNVPARKKFQKSTRVNAAEVTKIVSLLALAHPNIGFELIHQDENILFAPAPFEKDPEKILRSRIGDVLGEEFLKEAHLIEASDWIRGFVGSPSCTRPNRTGQQLFINHRPIVSPLLSFAVKEAYGTRIDTNRYPMYVIHLQIPPDSVDVNVHPQKKEVRFREEREIREKVRKAISDSLLRIELVSQNSENELKNSISFTSPPLFLENYFSSASSPILKFKEEENIIDKQGALEISFKAELKAIGVFSSYLLIEAGSVASRLNNIKNLEKLDGILLVDLIAARFRLAFEKMLKENRQNESQTLLIPYSCNLSSLEAGSVEANIEYFCKIGIGIRSLGRNSFIIESIPTFMHVDDLSDFLSRAVEELNLLKDNDIIDKQRERHIAAIASRFARTEKNDFMLKEAIGLFEELLTAECPYQCPQGNPTMVHLSLQEMGKYFDVKKR
jgi:DNA mismatch repair protein MutL